jgi:hypothetical protein
VAWLDHVPNINGLAMSILRWANAMNDAVRHRASLGLRIGTFDLSHPPAIDPDGTARYDSGVPFYSVQEDLQKRDVRRRACSIGSGVSLARISRHRATASVAYVTGGRSVVAR